MKKLLYILILIGTLCQYSPLYAETKRTEELTYDVYFHLGFIWAKAGRGILSYSDETTADGTIRKHGQLAAKSLNIVEHIMKVRDTLDCWMNDQLVPTEFVKKTHEGKYNCIEHNNYITEWESASAPQNAANVASSTAKIHRWLKKGKEPASVDDTTHVVNEPAYDMLSLFYVIRDLDFAKLAVGKKMKYACFSGLKKDWINVEFQGEEKIKLRNGKEHDAYLVFLTFATKGQDSTPLKVWMAKTQDHRPLKVIIGLKRIGSVQGEIVE